MIIKLGPLTFACAKCGVTLDGQTLDIADRPLSPSVIKYLEGTSDAMMSMCEPCYHSIDGDAGDAPAMGTLE